MKWGGLEVRNSNSLGLFIRKAKKLWYFQILIVILQHIRVTKNKEDYNMTKIMSNPKEPTVTYRHDYATEAHNESEEYPFMASCNNDELVNHVFAREEEYARTGYAVDFLEMMADLKTNSNGKDTSI